MAARSRMTRITLSSKEMWAKGYSGSLGPPSYADPNTRCGAFELISVFRRFLEPGNGKRLLEMGCGGSKYLPWLAREMGFQVEGIDYTTEGCELAKRNLEAAGVAGNIHCLDFLSLGPEFAGRFDVVTSYGVLEHFAEPVNVLKAFVDCIRPGGTLVSFVPNMQGAGGRLVKRVNRSLYETHYLFDLSKFREFHVQAGMTVVHCRYSEFCDFGLVPFGKFGRGTELICKNIAHYLNRARLVAIRRFPSIDPQSPLLCSGMIVVAIK